jgi:hypothetical protein
LPDSNVTFAKFKRDFARFKRGNLPDSNVETFEAYTPPNPLYNGSHKISSLEMSAVFCAGFCFRRGFSQVKGVDDIHTNLDKIATLVTWNALPNDSPGYRVKNAKNWVV